MKIKMVAVAVVGVVGLLVAGCGDGEDAPAGTTTPVSASEQSATTTSAAAASTSSAATLSPLDPGVSKTYNVEVSIQSVENATSAAGPVTVFTFQLTNNATSAFDGQNWPTPSVAYGAAGTPADQVVSSSEGYGAGVAGAIPPGGRQTAKYAYKVTKDQLNPAVVKVGSLVWQGDFANFKR